MAAVHAGGGTSLGRDWIFELGLIGGLNNTGEGLDGYQGAITTQDTHTGRFSLMLTWNQTFGPQLAFHVAPNTAYTLTAYIKGAGTTGTPHLYVSNALNQQAYPQGAVDAHGWQKVTATFYSGANTNTVLSLGVFGTTAGHLLVDDVTVAGPNGGDVLGGAGGFEWHTNYKQDVAAQVDQMVQSAQAQGQYLKLVCLPKLDQCFGSPTCRSASAATCWRSTAAGRAPWASKTC